MKYVMFILYLILWAMGSLSLAIALYCRDPWKIVFSVAALLMVFCYMTRPMLRILRGGAN